MSGPQIDDFDRLGLFASQDVTRPAWMARPWCEVRGGAWWSIATCGRLLVAMNRRVKWAEELIVTGREYGALSWRAREAAEEMPKEKCWRLRPVNAELWSYIEAIDTAAGWKALADVELPAAVMDRAEDLDGCTYDEACEWYGEDEVDWAPWERPVAIDVCGHHVAVPFLRKLRACLPDVKIALGLPNDEGRPMGGTFMGPTGRWLLMPIRRG